MHEIKEQKDNFDLGEHGPLWTLKSQLFFKNFRG